MNSPTDCSSGIKSSAPTSAPLGRTPTTFQQSDMPSVSPFPFPLPEDFLQMDKNIPSTNVPLIYLQWQCPICFSGMPNLESSTCILNSEVYNSMETDISISAQAIVCVDTNFAQRRHHLQHPDPVDPHPNTHFLLVDDVESMKCAVEHARPSDPKANAKLWARLPDNTLDDCEKAFTATQGHIAMSSSTIFADTALMALLCCHDCPLFLVNMTSAGKQQYHTLALIKALFWHLPDGWVIGLLYNVACQLEHSMCKVCVSDAITVPRLSQALAQLLG